MRWHRGLFSVDSLVRCVYYGHLVGYVYSWMTEICVHGNFGI